MGGVLRCLGEQMGTVKRSAGRVILRCFRLEIHHTPKHECLLNIAKMEKTGFPKLTAHKYHYCV